MKPLRFIARVPTISYGIFTPYHELEVKNSLHLLGGTSSTSSSQQILFRELYQEKRRNESWKLICLWQILLTQIPSITL